jgi:hypothetical protein
MVMGWTQDDGQTNVGSPSTYQTEQDMKNTIKGLLHALTDEDCQTLFSYYPASDFEEDLQDYEARKRPSDPVVPVHYYRIARIMRDLLYTCSSIDLGYEMSRQSRALNRYFPGVRLYDFNQTMFTPLYNGAGRPYQGVSHGSDEPYVYNGLFVDGNITDVDKDLSKAVAGAFIQFAHTGNPSCTKDDRFKLWPESFPASRALGSNTPSGPSSIYVEVIGGPWGTGPGYLTNQQGILGSIQALLGVGATKTDIDSSAPPERLRQLQRQKLLQRCKFINSLSERMDN